MPRSVTTRRRAVGAEGDLRGIGIRGAELACARRAARQAAVGAEAEAAPRRRRPRGQHVDEIVGGRRCSSERRRPQRGRPGRGPRPMVKTETSSSRRSQRTGSARPARDDRGLRGRCGTPLPRPPVVCGSGGETAVAAALVDDDLVGGCIVRLGKDEARSLDVSWRSFLDGFRRSSAPVANPLHRIHDGAPDRDFGVTPVPTPATGASMEQLLHSLAVVAASPSRPRWRSA